MKTSPNPKANYEREVERLADLEEEWMDAEGFAHVDPERASALRRKVEEQTIRVSQAADALEDRAWRSNRWTRDT